LGYPRREVRAREVSDMEQFFDQVMGWFRSYFTEWGMTKVYV